ncbi:hypothetical protein [Methylobacterium variabile]|uniref:hypothetical protein n=1 Tax=Methylobacterium variabile TaxID=298794 RepID=UPI0024770002|nr:hypothetical protein [Methylobacterium variabile]
MGGTIDEAIGNAGEALREWIGDRLAAGAAPPAPRTADALLADPDEAGRWPRPPWLRPSRSSWTRDARCG